MERTRKAAKVEMINKIAEAAASAELNFNRKLAQMSEGGDTALSDALAQVEELTSKVRASVHRHLHHIPSTTRSAHMRARSLLCALQSTTSAIEECTHALLLVDCARAPHAHLPLSTPTPHPPAAHTLRTLPRCKSSASRRAQRTKWSRTRSAA